VSLTRNEAREAFYQYFASVWADAGNAGAPHTPYWFDDEDAEPVNGPWVRFSVRHQAAPLESFGQQRKVQQRGTVFLQYFHPPGTGGEVADAHMKRFLDAFGFTKVPNTDIRCFEAVGRELGIVEQGRWWSQIGEAEFTYTTTQ
jgi:hypothetical protein